MAGKTAARRLEQGGGAEKKGEEGKSFLKADLFRGFFRRGFEIKNGFGDSLLRQDGEAACGSGPARFSRHHRPFDVKPWLWQADGFFLISRPGL